MLTQIGLKNFKLHADTKIDAAPLTVFIGPNNSGKSSLFQALLLWRQAAKRNERRLCLGWSKQPQSEHQPYVFVDDQLIDIGEFEQVVRHGERETSIRVSGSFPPSKQIEYGPGPTHANLEVRIRENDLIYHRGEIEYEFSHLDLRKQLSWEWTPGRPAGRFGLASPLPAKNAQIGCETLGTLSLIGNVYVSSGGFNPSPEESTALGELARRFSESVPTFLNSIHVVYPLRGFEEVGYPQAPAPSPTMDRMAVADRTIALLSILDYNRDIERRLSSWLENLVGINIEIKRLPGFRVTLLSSVSRGRQVPSLFSNEGTGTSQLPFILVPIGLTPPGETILLSEPEVHLHPKLQVQLGALLIRLMKEEKRQFFIETHSEHILHALLNAVAMRTIERSDLAIYYFENKNGASACTRLEIDERGGVKGGLPGFFDQSLGELTEYLEALKTK